VVITNLAPLSPFTVTTGSGVYPNLNELQEFIRNKTARLIAFDAAALAMEAGNILSLNMVLLGALSQTGTVPISSSNVQRAIKKITRKGFVESNLKAFDLGFSAAASSNQP
jgi:indolepyruvate ferredoxin oxidoreductase beta subunit